MVILSSNDGNATKTSVENKHLGNGDSFVIIASSSRPLLLTELKKSFIVDRAAEGLVEAPLIEVNIRNEIFTAFLSSCY